MITNTTLLLNNININLPSVKHFVTPALQGSVFQREGFMVYWREAACALILTCEVNGFFLKKGCKRTLLWVDYGVVFLGILEVWRLVFLSFWHRGLL
jgi:hypothetical protein